MLNSKINIEYYNDFKPKLSAICLKETWLGSESELSLLQIPEYNLISRGKSCTAPGGVAISLNKCFDYNIIEHGVRSNIWNGQVNEICNEHSKKKKLHAINTDFQYYHI